jgi:hypothetical protein
LYCGVLCAKSSSYTLSISHLHIIRDEEATVTGMTYYRQLP